MFPFPQDPTRVDFPPPSPDAAILDRIARLEARVQALEFRNGLLGSPHPLFPVDGMFSQTVSDSQAEKYRGDKNRSSQVQITAALPVTNGTSSYVLGSVPTPQSGCDDASVVVPPTDWSAVELTNGLPVDDKHRETDPETGLQKAYVVLNLEERAKGYRRPVRTVYQHLRCGKTTVMSDALAETYAREPSFYTGTYCPHCRGNGPVGENGDFVWMDGTKVGT